MGKLSGKITFKEPENAPAIAPGAEIKNYKIKEIKNYKINEIKNYKINEIKN
jgi:hypothetical protein